MGSRTVSLQTTVVGAFPKPAYLKIPDWFQTAADKRGLLGTNTHAHTEWRKGVAADGGQQLERDIMKATKEVIEAQHRCGVDVVTDGEVRRENYIHHLCRFIEGIDFDKLTSTVVRTGAFTAGIPTIVGEVKRRDGLSCADEWRKSQEVSSAPVKYTLPGPMTIMGSTSDAFYKDESRLAFDLARIVNRHVLELAEAGCKHIQIDEPLFARKPDEALAYGVKALDACFEGCPPSVVKTMHMCCGYPGHLDQEDYQKADRDAYFRLAPAVDACCVDEVSLEDAWCGNDLSLLRHFKRTKVILGTINVASSRIERVEDMKNRLAEALKHIEPDRLIVAPDCGLGLLCGEHRAALDEKLTNMCLAAREVPFTGKRGSDE